MERRSGAFAEVLRQAFQALAQESKQKLLRKTLGCARLARQNSSAWHEPIKFIKRIKMQVKINVFLKEGVLDPAGKATRHVLSSLGFAGVKEVRIGKQIVINFDNEVSDEKIKEMCDELLANPVIEDYEILK